MPGRKLFAICQFLGSSDGFSGTEGSAIVLVRIMRIKCVRDGRSACRASLESGPLR